MSHAIHRLGRTYAATQWGFYLSGTIALILTNIIVLEIPLLAKDIIDALVANQLQETYTKVAIGIIALGFLQIVIRTASRVLIFWPGRALEAKLKSDLFATILKAPMNIIRKYSVGELTSRLNNDVTQLRIFFAFGALQVLNVIFISIFTISKMTSIDKTLTALTLSPMLVMLVLTRLAMPKLYQSMRDNTEALGRLTGKVSEAFSHVPTIQLMNAVQPIAKQLEPDNLAIFRSNIKTIWLRTITWPVMTVLIGVSQFATLAFGGKQIMNGTLSVGDIMAFNIYIGMLTFPFASLGIILNVYQRAKPASERIETIQTIPSESLETTKTAPYDKATHPLLEVKDLSFYWDDGRIGLKSVSFSIEPGERIGIYGKIGSGKTTLFNLLTKLYPPTEGTICLKGKDINHISPSDVRSCIGYALQTPLLLSESIRSNMLLGLDGLDIDAQQIEEAAEKADILQDIRHLPQGWETLVGERGIKLSGGQKQRLALARVLLRPASLIILDDVLSAVDHETEHRLISNLASTDAALLIASHRPSILKSCSKVMVMEGGQIVSSGRYADVQHFIETSESEASD